MNGNFEYYTNKLGEYYKDKYGATKNVYKLIKYDTWTKIYTAKDQFGNEWVVSNDDLLTRLQYLRTTKAVKVLFGTNSAI